MIATSLIQMKTRQKSATTWHEPHRKVPAHKHTHLVHCRCVPPRNAAPDVGTRRAGLAVSRVA